MKLLAAFLVPLFLAFVLPLAAQAQCHEGAFGPGNGDFVALSNATGHWRYLFRDGRRGDVGAADSAVACREGGVSVALGAEAPAVWPQLPLRETDTVFLSAATKLAGRLVEPVTGAGPKPPLAVLVHGSEHTPWIGGVYGYALAAQGVTVFVYDKRGTGASEGDYTQNFELLADDAAAALREARRLSAGRVGRAGYFGGSQGGWVAPLAATRSPADFVAVAFGLVETPIEEDRDQMLDEARQAHLDAHAVSEIRRLSDATARLIQSHFTQGFEDLERLRQEVNGVPWTAMIKGEYSGDMLRMSDADLRRIGRARFDNLEVIWDYDAPATLRRLQAPLLWVLAGEDREAPIEQTRATLLSRAQAGQNIDIYLFPATDHGMVEFRTTPDGSRQPTRITDGYLRLVADWIKQGVHGSYGRGVRIH